MTEPAIRVHRIGKHYRLGAQSAPGSRFRYKSLAEAVSNGFRYRRKERTKKLSSADPADFWALRDISFDVHAGEVVGIIGRNGAGKSTLLKILSRITEPTDGYADIQGRVGSLLEVGTGFHPELTGRENIYLNGAILGMSQAEIRRNFDEIVAFSEVERFLDTPVKHYSSGMYTRLAFAVAAHLADTGPGISPEVRGRLFTPFDRFGAERGNVEGTGLGLAMSKRLMQAMGGDLGLEESPAALFAAGANDAAPGAVFWLELPLAADPLKALAVANGHATIDPSYPEPLPGGRTLLYIEDNVSNLTLIERLLQALPGVRLLTATQGVLGLDLARQQRPDLILLDVHLPDLPGWEVLARLQADESTRDIPVIVISADATERQIERLRLAGAHAYLTKPLDVRNFIEVVRGALSERGV